MDANSGTLNNMTINENCQIKGTLSANQIKGDIVKTVSKAFPRTGGGGLIQANGTIRVVISDDQSFDRQIIIPPIIFIGHESYRTTGGENGSETHRKAYTRLTVRKNGVTIYDVETLNNAQAYSDIFDMPAGGGDMQLEFSVVSDLLEYLTSKAISNLQVIVVKKGTAGISIS
nr:DUF3672 domain-containing protein [Escherichia coli]